MSGGKWSILHPSTLLHSRERCFPWHAFVSKWVRRRSVRWLPNRAAKREEHRLWALGVDFLQWVAFLWPLYARNEGWSSQNRNYYDYTASAEEWTSIISLTHMWQFEHMSEVAFRAYAALPNVSPVEKITMSQKYDSPRKHLVDAYLEICSRDQPVSVEEGDRIGVEALALITQTREELQRRWKSWPTDILKQVVIHNLVDLEPSFKFERWWGEMHSRMHIMILLL